MSIDTVKINQNFFTKRTGDPFADTGGFVIEQLWKMPELKGKTIFQLIEYATKVYVNNWNGKLHAFFLNSKITQPAFKPPKKIEETLKYYKGLLEESEPNEIGYCRILGIKTKLFPGGRDNHILSGSGTFLNFHHSFQNGIMLSKEVLIRTFFVPLGALQLSDKIAIISSNNEKVSKRFVRQNVIDNISRIGAKSADGVLRSDFNNPASAMFDFVHSCLTDKFVDLAEDEDVEINLYHFTNFGASPEVVFYNFSSPLFSFYRKVLHRDLESDWKKFVRKHYYNSKHKEAHYDSKSDLFVSEKKKPPIEYKQYKTWVNWIYQDLIASKNMLSAMLRWTKKNSFNFQIVRLYQNHLKNMDNKTLDKIEALADYVIADESKLKKRIGTLNRAEKVTDIRRFILGLVKENHSKQNDEALITIKEYVNYLFPDGTSAKEIRDLLLIALYQKMHENKIFFEIEEVENIIESEN
jgi:CRISPR-associated protein Cst1